ncbi:MAG: hypothetical protein GXX86_08325 [Propionibacterium sp.]|nr:hypothetical protein [Propionibacterium sp.]
MATNIDTSATAATRRTNLVRERSMHFPFRSE